MNDGSDEVKGLRSEFDKAIIELLKRINHLNVHPPSRKPLGIDQHVPPGLKPREIGYFFKMFSSSEWMINEYRYLDLIRDELLKEELVHPSVFTKQYSSSVASSKLTNHLSRLLKRQLVKKQGARYTVSIRTYISPYDLDRIKGMVAEIDEERLLFNEGGLVVYNTERLAIKRKSRDMSNVQRFEEFLDHEMQDLAKRILKEAYDLFHDRRRKEKFHEFNYRFIQDQDSPLPSLLIMQPRNSVPLFMLETEDGNGLRNVSEKEFTEEIKKNMEELANEYPELRDR